MSSQPPEPPPAPPSKWPRWRISMLIGAVILLASAILDAAVEPPRWLYVSIFFVGYVFLSYGFFLALGARKKGSTPRGRG